jgi:NADH-quinone oxidoreductase subunit A
VRDLYIAGAMSVDYSPVLVALLFSTAFGLLFYGLSTLLGPKHETAQKLQPFECGSEPIGSPRVRFSVKFYQVAILFLVFDIESAFMYPWAILYRKLSCAGSYAAGVCTGGITLFGFGEMLVFIAVLVVALAYVWRKKAIGWG